MPCPDILESVDPGVDTVVWPHFINMINECESGHTTAYCDCSSEAGREALVRGSQQSLRKSVRQGRPQMRENLSLRVMKIRSDFLCSQFLTECFLEQNLNYNSDQYLSMSQDKVSGMVTQDLRRLLEPFHFGVVK